MLSNPRIDLILNKRFVMNRPKEWFKAFLCAINYIIFGIIVIYFMMALSGCSVYMAAKGREIHSPELVMKGMTRQQVLKFLGKPVITARDGNGKIISDLFIVNSSDYSSKKRALMHASLDVVTLGIWEMFGTVMESRIDNNYYKIVVQYDTSMRVKNVKVKSLSPKSKVKMHYHYHLHSIY